MVKTGKVTNVENKGDTAVIDITFMDNIKTRVTLPHEDSHNYKDKYVICAIDFHDVVNIVEILDHVPV